MFAASKTAAITTAANWVEECFSVYLYTGNGSTQTITNGIDLSGKGGMVWLKRRDTVADNLLLDTVRGGSQLLFSNLTSASTGASLGWSFNSNGFNFTSSSASTNASGGIYASWTFREQAKFFDVVTYTGTGVARTVAHNLGSVPGCMIIKRTDTTGNWGVYHRSIANTDNLFLNTTGAATSGVNYWNSTTPTSTEFTVGTNANVNASGGTYVAYLFAHDAGGFGATGTDNVISCGSFTTNTAETVTVNLGYEPQFVIVKRSDAVGDWYILDTMRGWDNSSSDAILYPNYSNAEGSAQRGEPNATGFRFTEGAVARTYIYIAIRRGPMKTPTSGTSVYEGTAYTGNAAAQRQIGSTVLLDALLLSCRSANSVGWTGYAHFVFDRLRGNDVSQSTSLASAQDVGWSTYIDFDKNIGWDTSSTTSQGYLNNTGSTFVSYAFSRAPGFFDVVCDTGTGVAKTVTHGLTVVPELMIRKKRNSATNSDWVVWHSSFSGTTKFLYLNATDAEANNAAFWTSTAPTSSVFSLGNGSRVNNSGDTFVTYLFASVNGVSKVGSYTGNGSSQAINCGFAAGARFILIKRTSSTGDWYVWDTARGIVSGNDPRLSLNTTAAEVTTDDSIDPDNSGFIVNQLAATNINVNAATYIYLAIA